MNVLNNYPHLKNLDFNLVYNELRETKEFKNLLTLDLEDDCLISAKRLSWGGLTFLRPEIGQKYGYRRYGTYSIQLNGTIRTHVVGRNRHDTGLLRRKTIYIHNISPKNVVSYYKPHLVELAIIRKRSLKRL